MNRIDKKLLHAIEEGDLEAIRTSLRWGADPNAVNEEQDDDPLIFAAFQTETTTFKANFPCERAESFYCIDINTAVIDALHSAGAKSEVRNSEGETPLTIAVEWMNFEAAKSLLDHGADVNFTDDLGRTPLWVAANCQGSSPSSSIEQETMIRYLFERGSNINAQSIHGETALIRAVVNEDLPIVELLLELGADAEIANDSNQTAIYYAGRIDNPAKRERITGRLQSKK